MTATVLKYIYIFFFFFSSDDRIRQWGILDDRNIKQYTIDESSNMIDYQKIKTELRNVISVSTLKHRERLLLNSKFIYCTHNRPNKFRLIL
jgi:hypothetical protein